MTRPEVELPAVVLLRNQCDRLADKNLTDEHKVTFPFDTSVRMHEANRERTWILDLGDSFWEGSAILLNSTGRCVLPEGLMRSRVIELFEEGIESSLL